MRRMVAPEENQVEMIYAKEILGNTLTDGEFCLTVSRKFYGDISVEIDELGKFMAEATIANLTGNNVVEHAVELGFVDKNRVII